MAAFSVGSGEVGKWGEGSREKKADN